MRFSLERKLVAAVVVLFLIPTVLAGAILLLLYRRGVLEDPWALAVTVAVGFVTMMAYLGVVAHRLGRALVRTIQRIQLGTEMMAGVNPAHRLDVRTGDELEALAEEINRMAHRLAGARRDLEDEVARATRELTIERGKLRAVLEALGEGVIVATLDGQVILGNPVARDLVGAAPGTLLGRSLFDSVDREQVTHFLERLARGSSAERFSLPLPSGAVLQAVMTPFSGDERGLVGFVLVLRDVTRPARLEQERQRRFGEVLRELRGPLASIRSLSESLLGEEPAASGETVRRFVAAIHAEALRLSTVIAAAGAAEGPGLAALPTHFETISPAELIAMILRRLGPDGGMLVVPREGDLAALAPLRAEAATLSGGLAHLLRAVLDRREPSGRAWLSPRPQGRLLQIDVSAEGTAAVVELETLLDAPVPLGQSGRFTVREVVRHHSGEAWAYGGGGRGRFGFRLTLPVEEVGAASGPGPDATGAGFIGAGLVSGVSAVEEPPPRPDSYDFSLADEMERSLLPGDRERRLDELTFTVFDTETTGLDPDAGDRIVSLAAVRVRGGALKPGEIFDALVNPGRPVPPGSARFHGITDEMVAEAPPIGVVLPAFLRFSEGTVLVGHQVWFDLRFLERAAGSRGLPPVTLRHAVLDTLLLSGVVHGPFETHGLETLARRFDVAVRGRHSALGDALMTAEVLVRLLELLKKRGISTLGAALEATRRVRRLGTSAATGGGS